ncbi:hypothetical protein D9M71_496480 [compost metagenome]
MQAEITQLYAAGLGYTGPTWHGDAVPGAQAAFQAGRIDLVQSHLPVVFGFDFARCQRDDPGFVGLAVQTVGCQLGIIGVGRDDHHPLTPIIRMFQCPQHRLTEHTTETPAQAQLTTRQRLSLTTEIEVTQAVYASFEGLSVRVFAPRQLDHWIDKTSQPGAFHPQGQHQRRIVDQHHALVQPQMFTVQVHLGLGRVGGKAVLVIVFR